MRLNFHPPRAETGKDFVERACTRVRARERYRVTERRRLGFLAECIGNWKTRTGVFKGGKGHEGKDDEGLGGGRRGEGSADTRKSGVAEMGKREEKRRGRGLPATQAHQ